MVVRELTTGRVLHRLVHPDVSSATSSQRGPNDAKAIPSRAAAGVRVRVATDADSVRILAFSETGSELLTATGSIIRGWDLSNGSELFEYQASGRPTTGQFSRDADIVMVQTDVTDHVLRVATGASLLRLPGSRLGASISRLSPTGEHVALERGGEVKVVRVRDGSVLWSVPLRQTKPLGAFTQDGTHYLEADGNTVKLWSINSAEVVRVFEHSGRVQYMRQSENGRLLVTVSERNIVTVWSLESGELHVTRSWDAIVRDPFFDSESKFVLVNVSRTDGLAAVKDSALATVNRLPRQGWARGTSRGMYRRFSEVWDWSDDRVLGRYPGWAGDISQDGRFFLTTDDDAARLWYLDHSELISIACQRVTRNLDAALWRREFGDEARRATCPGLP